MAEAPPINSKPCRPLPANQLNSWKCKSVTNIITFLITFYDIAANFRVTWKQRRSRNSKCKWRLTTRRSSVSKQKGPSSRKYLGGLALRSVALMVMYSLALPFLTFHILSNTWNINRTETFQKIKGEREKWCPDHGSHEDDNPEDERREGSHADGGQDPEGGPPEVHGQPKWNENSETIK